MSLGRKFLSPAVLRPAARPRKPKLAQPGPETPQVRPSATPDTSLPFGDVQALQGMREGFARGSGAPVAQQGLRNGLSGLTDDLRAMRLAVASGFGNTPLTGVPGTTTVYPAAGGTLQRLADSIARTESQGNYNAIGLPTKYGRARGKYQFLPTTYAAAAPRYGVDPNDWSPAAQDKVALGEMDRLLRKFGNDPALVAEAWYRGENAVGAPGRNAPQSAGGKAMPPISDYARKILAGMR